MNEKSTRAPAGIIAVTQTPYIINDDGIYKSETFLTLESLCRMDNAWVKITVPGKAPGVEAIGGISPGTGTRKVHVMELEKDGDCVAFALFDNPSCAGVPLASAVLPQKKVRRWTVYVSHSTHMDIGYTDYQEHLRNIKWPGHIDDAFRFIKETDSWSEDEKFRHHIESSYMLYGSALNVRSAEWVRNLAEQLEKGRLAYSASCMNTSMEVMGAEQLVRYYYYSQRLLKDILGADSSGVAMMVDNPSISWANMDVMAGAGVKYMYIGPNFNPNTPLTLTEAYPRLFYMAGRNPANKVLLISGNLYNLDEMQFVYDGPEALPVSLETTVKCTGDVLMNVYHKDNYPYDAVLQMVDQYWDNGPLFPQVMERVREMNARTDELGRPYIYPKFINSNIKDFCGYIENKYGASIPAFTGTYENWWCFGTPSDAYSAAETRYAHDRLPEAEMFAALACLSADNSGYPCNRIADAYNYMMLYDEHTFGPSVPAVGDQHLWKRNNAIACKRLADDITEHALGQLNTLIPAEGRTIVVHNSLAWERSGIVRVGLSELPGCFAIIDMETSEEVKYQKVDGAAEFLAAKVPGPGYKCFGIRERPDEPVFETGIKTTLNSLENEFFKVTVDSRGEIVSILDKKNGSIELVDGSSDNKMNEFLYMVSDVHGHKLHSVSRVENASFAITAGAVEGRIVSRGFCEGTAGIERNVILYDAVPRIDMVNILKKNDALAWRKQDEEGYFTFPLKVPDFILRHEMPTGDVRPFVAARHADPAADSSDIEQFYTSSTDFYTVNRWIDASSRSQKYGITLSALSAPIVQYGERRSLLYDIDYNTEKPWVFSYVLNNKWGTNFMDTQPGLLTFRYAVQSHAGGNWRDGRADRFGWETSVPLSAKVIGAAQAGAGLKAHKGQWIQIDADNVALTAMKPAEANGEGMILRFNETLGKNTKVKADLSYFQPSGITETDLVENDKAPISVADGCVSFDIDAYGWKTIRVRFGTAPDRVTGVTAVTDHEGTLVAWAGTGDPRLAFYEIFRGTDEGFTPGTGNYLGSAAGKSYYDRQVTAALTEDYYYKVRAVRCGLKGEASAAVKAVKGQNTDNEPPGAPAALRADYALGNRVSLSWLPSTDNLCVKGYKVYKDGIQVADLASMLNSYLDVAVIPGRTYSYSVRAYDQAGNPSGESNTVTVTTAKGDIKPGNIGPDASVLTSSQYSDANPATAVIDGFAGVTGEWVSSGEATPWIKLAWEEAHAIRRIVLYGRDTDANQIRKGILHFSDGSAIELEGFRNDGSVRNVEFPEKTVTWVKFQVTAAKGWNVGLAEIEVF